MTDSGFSYGPRPLNSTGRHGLFLNSTCHIRVSDMRHGGKKDSDMRHGYFLNSTCDMVGKKRQRHATSGPPVKGPIGGNTSGNVDIGGFKCTRGPAVFAGIGGFTREAPVCTSICELV